MEKKNTKKEVIKEVEETKINDISDRTKTLVLSIGWIATAVVLVVVLLMNRIPKLENGNEVVASIDGLEISANDFYTELKGASGYYTLNDMIDKFIAKKEVKDTTKAYEYADSYIEYYRLQYEQNNMDFEEEIEKTGTTLEEIREGIAMDYLVQQAAEEYVKSTIKDEEIDTYYKDNIYEELTVRHILIKSNVSSTATDDEKKKAEEEALKKANEILAKYKNGEDFAELAKTYSEDTGTKEDGGLYANFNQTNTDQAFFKAAYALKDGQVTDTPVKSQYGYHLILKVGENAKPKKEEVKDEILDGILKAKENEDSKIYDKAWVTLRENYNFQIFDTKLKSTYKTMAEDIKNS